MSWSLLLFRVLLTLLKNLQTEYLWGWKRIPGTPDRQQAQWVFSRLPSSFLTCQGDVPVTLHILKYLTRDMGGHSRTLHCPARWCWRIITSSRFPEFNKLGNCCTVRVAWIPPVILSGQCSTFLRLGPCKLVVAVNGEKHVWLDHVKQATGDSSMHDWALTCYSLGNGYIGLIKVWSSTRFWQTSSKGSRYWKPLSYPHMGLSSCFTSFVTEEEREHADLELDRGIIPTASIIEHLICDKHCSSWAPCIYCISVLPAALHRWYSSPWLADERTGTQRG